MTDVQTELLQPETPSSYGGAAAKQTDGRICLQIVLPLVMITLFVRCDCAPGIYNDTTSDPEAYYLPFAAGTRVWVGQGYNGVLSHSGDYAVDFLVPEGTLLAAARGGTIVDLKEDSTCNEWTILGLGWNDPACR